MRFTFLTPFLLFTHLFFGQNHTISGYLTDKESGEMLIGATIFAPAQDQGATSNSYGFYSITLPNMDSIILIYSYLGYTPKIKKIYLQQNLRLDVRLGRSTLALGEVVVVANEKLSHRNVSRPQMGIVDIPIEKIKDLPVILGEPDILKVIQFLPGVQSGNEGTTGFHVRGGNTDQNLVQLDEAVVYNPNHLFGLFSTFNSRALNNATLIKGGFPAQYGGRLSSILDIKMKEGNNQKFSAEGGIGLISSQLTLQGPLKKEKASFILSGRRTYLDLLARPFLPKGNNSDYHFYDVNAKLNWRLSIKDRLFLSAFQGKDKAVYKERQGINYTILFGNSTATLRWNHLFSPKIFANTSLIVNNYDQDISTNQDNSFSRVFSGIRDISAKMEFQYFPNTNHSIRFGGHYINHKFRSSGKSGARSSTGQEQPIDVNAIPPKYVNEWAVYFNDEWILSDKVSANLGLRVPGFFSNDATYTAIEPRASLKYALNDSASVKVAFAEMNQYLHLIPSSTASVPSDIWIPSTDKTKPQISRQISLGYFRNFRQNQFEGSVELYYKTMDNQVLFREGNQLVETLDVDSFLAYGKGWSYGAEFFLRKTSGSLTGWISYTLSKTDQEFPELNFGEKFPFRYDRRHDLSVVASYQLSKRWTVSAAFVYSTGTAFTLPVGRINVFHKGTLFEGNYFVYEGRNNTRLNAYHRLDLSARYKKSVRWFKQSGESELLIGLYNVYSRLNPYFVYFFVDPAVNQPKAKQVSLLPIIPSINYNFKF